MRNKSLISVIIPCYNGSEFIEETIHCVLGQSYANLEVLVINDGSTDNSIEIINSIQDDRLVLINKKNEGVSVARNHGFNLAKGEYVIFLDADDVLTMNFFEEAVSVFQADSSLDFLTVDISQINELSEQILKNIELRGTFENVQNEIVSFLPHISTCPSAYIYQSAQLRKHNITFNKALSSPADRYFLLEVGAFLKGGFIEKAHLKYRVHANSMSHFKSEKLVVDQENYLIHTLKKEVLTSKKDELIFKRKLAYQLFVDYLKMKCFSKSLKYGNQYLKSYF